ncbi:MAG: helix-turn-helix domain-containing protein [Bradyrhizobium sp.]|nr:helix-turn-helix domain-containing protein [Bradyrhizobium sp.]
MSNQSAIERAADGNMSELARKVGLTPQAVQKWCARGKPPAERVLEIERVTGVPRYELRPDIYPPPSSTDAPGNEASEAA